jgi:predicted DCC family thiol-disulfide oxidoreductase YuxK
METRESILLFDGVCNFCNSAVQFVLKRNSRKNICFAALQTTIANQLLKQYQLTVDKMDSLVYIHKGKAYTKSEAALQLCKQLRRGWPLLYAFIIVPKIIRDTAYDWIAKNRYRWFGIKKNV